ncbi:MAG: HAD-IA family hydrolase, partial [Pseudomonadota bacterium]
ATDPRQVAALLRGLETVVDPSVFDFIGDRTQASRTKPAPDIYNEALRKLDISADAALAIEDTPESAQAAVAAGIRTLGFPGAEVGNRSFPDEVEVFSALQVTLLRGTAAAA